MTTELQPLKLQPWLAKALCCKVSCDTASANSDSVVFVLVFTCCHGNTPGARSSANLDESKHNFRLEMHVGRELVNNTPCLPGPIESMIMTCVIYVIAMATGTVLYQV